MADYEQHYQEIRSAGASVAAVSVDTPSQSEALKVQLSLTFPILCDTERRVIREWNIYNPRVKGGIARPAVFVIDADQVVRYAAVDSVAMRVPAVEIASVLRNFTNGQPIRRRVHVPLLSDWSKAMRNAFSGR